MYQPIFKYTDLLVNNLLKVENLRTTISMTEISYNTKLTLQMKIKALNLFFIASFKNYKLDNIKECQKIVSGIQPNNLPTDVFTTLVNFRNYMDFAYSEASEGYMEYDINSIFHIHKLVTYSWRETPTLKFRNRLPNDIKTGYNWTDFIDNDITTEEKVTQSLNSLFEWYNDISNNLPILVKIGLFVFRLIEIQPFITNNFISIVAIIDFILYKYGYGIKNFFSTSRMLYSSQEELKKSIYYSKVNHSIEFWLEEFLDAIAKEYMNIKREMTEYLIEEEKNKKKPFLNLNKRQLKILQYLQNVPMIKRAEYCHIMEVSPMTAFRDLSDLVRKKLLKTEGVGKATRYKLYNM
ncbi:MAG: hypothetical protein NZZ41_05225 [Candidatus Dojkabacteria bacterium]|nr:hypothetical protein [Candidatus Dojkabacteria bacterium]